MYEQGDEKAINTILSVRFVWLFCSFLLEPGLLQVTVSSFITVTLKNYDDTLDPSWVERNLNGTCIIIFLDLPLCRPGGDIAVGAAAPTIVLVPTIYCTNAPPGQKTTRGFHIKTPLP